MDLQKVQLVTGALLHDIGKVVLRAGLGESRQNHATLGAQQLAPLLQGWPARQMVLDCLRYHHARALESAGLPPTHMAWLVCEADNIAAGADRRMRAFEGEDGSGGAMFSPRKCLDSVFNLVRTERCNQDTSQEFPLVHGQDEEQRWLAPVSVPQTASQAEYARIWQGLTTALGALEWGNPAYLNSLYSILDGYLSYVPSSTDTHQVADISLFDHASLTAAVASCMWDWAAEQGQQDMQRLYAKDAQAFRRQAVFLIVHADLSGIQEFLYTISSRGALKSLRGRSFYLELILEQMADEILAALELTRANLIYAGGGGFYLLVPNTRQAQDVLLQARDRFNQWLLDQFSIDLYLGLAWSPASAAQFMAGATDFSKPPASRLSSVQDPASTQNTADVFRLVSAQLSKQKLQRYAGPGDDLSQVFTPIRPEQGDRECSVCGRSSRLSKRPANAASLAGGPVSGPGGAAASLRMTSAPASAAPEDMPAGQEQNICLTCAGLQRLGQLMIQDRGAAADQRIQFLVTPRPERGDLQMPLPSLGETAWLTVKTTTQIRQILKQGPDRVTRIYAKNYRSSGLEVATRLWVGDYNYCVINEGGAVEFQDFVTMRGDQGIGRIAVMRADVDNLGSLFAGGFRGNAPDKATYETLGRYATLSRSLSRFFKSHINHIAAAEKRNIVLVYAGGDDVFAVGAWDEMIEFALDLREKFSQFTGDKLSFSAGIGFFRPDYPISRMAELTGELETMAKQGSKDQLALFGLNIREGVPACQHVFTWQRFRSGVLPKRDFLLRHLQLADAANDDFTSPRTRGQADDAKAGSRSRDTSSDTSAGRSFLYKVNELLLAADDKLSLARLAYLIARREPPAGASDERKAQYRELRDSLYGWALDPQARQELLTAIMLCIYTIRKRGD